MINWINIFYWQIIVSLIVFVNSSLFVDISNTPKWMLFTFFVLLYCIYISILLILNRNLNRILKFRIENFSVAIIFTLIFLSLLGIQQFISSDFSYISVKGMYDNPVGLTSTICIGLPYAFFNATNNNKVITYSSILSIILSSLVVVLSCSRVGILSLIFLFICYLLKLKKYKKLLICVLFFLVPFISLMILKSDSILGRFLIWRCTLSLIADSPIFGHGIGGFESKYMEYQAKYFQLHPDSKYVMVADNTQVPFNEYLHILSDFGVLGLMVILFLIILIFLQYMKYKHNTTTSSAMLSIAVVGIFALFSYPTHYPFTILVLCVSIALILSETHKYFIFPRWLTLCVGVLLLIGSVLTIGYEVKKVYAEIKWKSIAVPQLYSDKTMNKYADLYSSMKDNKYFLYNYAYALFHEKEYAKAELIARKCRDLWADYELEMLLGTISSKRYCYDEAIKYFTNAYYMCPSKFRPLYDIMKIYEKKEKFEYVKYYAEIILNKIEKISSPEVARIKKYAQTIIERMRMI